MRRLTRMSPRFNLMPAHNKRCGERVMDKFVLCLRHRRVADARR